MFAQVKQEFLEKRLRQQQIEQLLGHKSRPALPSTEADPTAGPSNALAPRDSTAEAPEASPGQAACTHSPVTCDMFYMSAKHYCMGGWQAVCSIFAVVIPVHQVCLHDMLSTVKRLSSNLQRFNKGVLRSCIGHRSLSSADGLYCGPGDMSTHHQHIATQ